MPNEVKPIRNAYVELVEALGLWDLTINDVDYITNNDFGLVATIEDFKRVADKDLTVGENQRASVSDDMVVILKNGARYIRTPDPLAKTPYGLWEWYYIPSIPATRPTAVGMDFDIRVDG